MLQIKPHPTRPNVYLTDDGRVFQECASYVDDSGYTVVSTRDGRGKGVKLRRHVLVCEASKGPSCPGKKSARFPT